MQIITDLLNWRKNTSLPSLGFVPTMGNLHQGHISLVERAQQDNEQVAVSIYVNPTQFNQTQDFTHYPRTLEEDQDKLHAVGVDYLLLPTYEQIYPDNFHYKVICDTEISQILEGEKRPGHFTGMLTVVLKLLQLTKAQRAYFGEKDFQQLQLIKGMVKAFFLDCEIIGCPTLREISGLAMSSRNNRLTAEQRQLADDFAKILHSGKPLTAIGEELRQKNIKVDYLTEYQGRIFVAVYIGEIRLIDNFFIK